MELQDRKEETRKGGGVRKVALTELREKMAYKKISDNEYVYCILAIELL